MKLRLILCSWSWLALLQCTTAQSPEKGDPFPDFVIRNIVNAPVKQADVYQMKKPFIILNFWGTWCAPCLPEMDSLKQLQAKYNSQVQIVAIAHDDEKRVKNYLSRKPTPVWISWDTSFYLYRFLGFDYVGQSVVLDSQRRVLGFVRTDSINDDFMRRMLHGGIVPQSGERSSVTAIHSGSEDPFPADSLTENRWVFESFRKGQPSMMKTYPKGAFQGRRLTFLNVCAGNILRTAFNITSNSLLRYDIPEKEVCDFSAKKGLYCFDFMVSPQQKDSLYLLLQQQLKEVLPVAFRIEPVPTPVYVLTLAEAGRLQPATSPETISYFSGRGFTGTNIPLATFAEYLANELGLPVVDETGLTGNFDIHTEIAMRTPAEVIRSIEALGLAVKKAEREMETLIISRRDQP